MPIERFQSRDQHPWECIEKKCPHKKRVELPMDWFGTPTWPFFHCFGGPGVILKRSEI